jgi:hypothetical protein
MIQIRCQTDLVRDMIGRKGPAIKKVAKQQMTLVGKDFVKRVRLKYLTGPSKPRGGGAEAGVYKRTGRFYNSLTPKVEDTGSRWQLRVYFDLRVAPYAIFHVDSETNIALLGLDRKGGMPIRVWFFREWGLYSYPATVKIFKVVDEEWES